MSKTEQPMSAGTQLTGDGSSMVYNTYDSEVENLTLPTASPPSEQEEGMFTEYLMLTEAYNSGRIDVIDYLAEGARMLKDIHAKHPKQSVAFLMENGITGDGSIYQAAADELTECIQQVKDWLEGAEERGENPEIIEEYKQDLVIVQAKRDKLLTIVNLLQPLVTDLKKEKVKAEVAARRRVIRDHALLVARQAENAAATAGASVTELLTAAAAQMRGSAAPPPSGKNSIITFIYTNGAAMIAAQHTHIADTQPTAGFYSGASPKTAGADASKSDQDGLHNAGAPLPIVDWQPLHDALDGGVA